MTTTPLSQQTIASLRECYNTHASKFSATRKKNRPEMDRVIERIIDLSSKLQKPIHILELGCGDGRLERYLAEHIPESVASYTGVDIAENLLTIAQQGGVVSDLATKKQKNQHSDTDTISSVLERPYSVERVHTDMLTYLEQQASGKVDLVISFASFQHIPDMETRVQVAQQIYRVLSYEGQWISVDRSRSQRLIQRYRISLYSSFKARITSRGSHEWNTLSIPFSDQGQTHYRLYHIFTRPERRRLTRKTGFQTQQRAYSSQNGAFHTSWWKARNLCLCLTKTIYQQS